MNTLEEYKNLIQDTLKFFKQKNLIHFTKDIKTSSIQKKEEKVLNSPPIKKILELKEKSIKIKSCKTIKKEKIESKSNFLSSQNKKSFSKVDTKQFLQDKKKSFQKKEILTDENKNFLSLEKPIKQEILYLKKTKETLLEIFPNSLFEKVLDDSKAIKNANKWKLKTSPLPITILYFKENDREILFLQNLATAIKNYFLPTKLISVKDLEKEDNFSNFFQEKKLKLIIAAEKLILEKKTFLKIYKEKSFQKDFFLKDIPLFLLPEISIFFKDFSLKKEIWKSLIKKMENIL